MNQDNSSQNNVQEKFQDIYLNRTWQDNPDELDKSASGPGSDLQNVQKYVDALQKIIRNPKFKIDSVVDIGCGDWTFSREIDWSNINYTGVDIVPEIASNLALKYGTANISFRQGNLISDELPSADLLIIKDVLQHLPNQAVSNFIASKLPKYRFALITNDVTRKQYPLYPLKYPFRSIGKQNIDISAGGWRPLKLQEAPFNLAATEVLTFSYRLTRTVFDTKEVLLCDSNNVGLR